MIRKCVTHTRCGSRSSAGVARLASLHPVDALPVADIGSRSDQKQQNRRRWPYDRYMSQTIEIPIPDDLTQRTATQFIDHAARTWEQARENTIEVDWRRLRRVEEPAGLIIAAGLLGKLAYAPLRVRLDLDRTRLRRLERCGIAFGLANRHGATEIVGASRADLNFEEWQRSWRPISKLISPEAFGESAVEPELTSTRHAAFVNAHLAGENEGRTEVRNRLRPWLRKLLFRDAEFADADLRAVFLRDVGQLVDELVRNVAHHAPLDVYGAPTVSLVRVALTDDRAHVSVQDNGRGIITTVREKIVSRLDDASLLQGVVEGSVAVGGRARGMGLPDVWELTANYRGTLSIVTGNVGLSSHDGGRLRVAASPVDAGGTIVDAMVRVPRPPASSE